MKYLTTILASAMFTMAVAAHSEHDQPEDKRDFEITQLTDNISVLIGVNGFTGGNIALLTGDDGVVMIDDSMPPLGEKLKAAIAKVTPREVDFIINTHVHGDHSGLNAFFAEQGSWIVGHENLRKQLAERGYGMNRPAPAKALPVITFSDQMSFHLNNQVAKVIHTAEAHTDGDAFIHYADANIIHTGDLMFNKLFPYIDISSGGSVQGYIDAQKTMLALSNENTQIIPGHGVMAKPADLQASIDMLEDSSSMIKALIDKGHSLEDVLEKNPLQKYHEEWNWGFITTERMTTQLYNGLK